jgi:hypothetical protein
VNTRTLQWLLPSIGIAIALIGLLIQRQRLEHVTAELSNAQKEVATAASGRKAAEAAESDMRYAAADPSSAEELRFMDRIRKQAQARGLEITSIGGSLVGKLERPLQSAEDRKKLEGIQEIATTLSLTGPYLSLRGFLQDVTIENRLCNIKGIRWERTESGSELSVTLARYIKASAATAP